MQETQVWFLGQKDPLEEGMGTHSSILVWKVPWTEEPGELQPQRVAKSQTQLKWLSTHTWGTCPLFSWAQVGKNIFTIWFQIPWLLTWSFVSTFPIHYHTGQSFTLGCVGCANGREDKQQDESESHSVVSGSLWPHGLYWGCPCGSSGKESACNTGDLGLIPGLGRSPGEGKGLYSPWNSPGQNNGVASYSFLQWIFPTQGSNKALPHCRWILYQLNHQGSPKNTIATFFCCSLK